MEFRNIFLTVMIIATNAEYTFKPVPEQTPMIITKLARAHVSYDAFKMVFYVDLTEYNRLTGVLHKCIDAAERATLDTFDPSYNFTLAQLKHRMELMNHDEELIRAFRQKRFVLCEFCGSVYHLLYGVMTEEQAQQWANVVNAIKNQTITDHDLLRQQTILTEAHLKHNKETFQKLETALDSTTNYIQKLASGTEVLLNNLQARVQAQNLIQITHLAFDEHAHLYGQIRRTLGEARRGKVTEIIPREKLMAELKRISDSLKSTQSLPIDVHSQNAMQIFKYSTISSTLFQDKLLIEINIPVTESENFNLFKATPIPISSNGNSVIATTFSTYFLLNTEATKYIAINQKQLQDGLMLADNQMLYKPTTTIILDNSGICEWKLQIDNNIDNIIQACRFQPYFNTNTFITILENDLYFVNTLHETRIWEKCGEEDYTPRNLSGRGTIQLDPNCSIKTNSFIIQSHRTRRINATSILQPEIAITKIIDTNLLTENNPAISLPKAPLHFVIHNSDEMQNMINSARDLAERASREVKLEDMKVETNTFSMFSGLVSSLTSILVIGTIAYFALKYINIFNCILKTYANHAVERGQNGEATLNIFPRSISVNPNPTHQMRESA